MSHELRTPLNIMIGLSDMLINERALKLDAARRGDYAQPIHDSSQDTCVLVRLPVEAREPTSSRADSAQNRLPNSAAAPARRFTDGH